MLAKISAVISSKVAIAALGGVLVVGGGATAAALATGHAPSQVSLLSHASGNDSDHDSVHDSNDVSSTHASGTHKVAIEGMLQKFASGHSASTNPSVQAVLLVKGKAQADDNGQNGQNKQNKQNDDKQGSASTTTKSTCTLSSPFSIGIDGNTKINGQAKTVSDLAKDVDHKVQIQAEEDSTCRLLATKVTVAAADDSSHGD